MSENKNRHSLILVGNSVNLIEKYNAGVAWYRLLNKLEDIYKPYLGKTNSLESLPLRMQAICNLYSIKSQVNPAEATSIVSDLNKWFKEIAELRPTAIHEMLAEIGFDTYLTTNYDFALERALKKKTKAIKEIDTEIFLKQENECSYKYKSNGKVIHIHGSIDDLSSIVMTPESYFKTAAELDRQHNDILWLEKFCKSEVHICGLNLQPDETLVWYALKYRLKHLHKKYDNILASYPRAYAYLFYNKTGNKSKHDYIEKCALKDLLRTYAVDTILIPVYNNDYITAWKQLIGELILAKNQKNIQKNPDGDDINEELERALKQTECGHGKIASKNRNLTTAFKTHYKYPYYCWMSMSGSKKGVVRKSGVWLCYCKIDSERHMFYFPAEGCIQRYLNNDKSNFLLNYRTGYLYAITSERLDKVGFGIEVRDLMQFVKMIT